jgi:hypothetical protein
VSTITTMTTSHRHPTLLADSIAHNTSLEGSGNKGPKPEDGSPAEEEDAGKYDSEKGLAKDPVVQATEPCSSVRQEQTAEAAAGALQSAGSVSTGAPAREGQQCLQERGTAAAEDHSPSGGPTQRETGEQQGIEPSAEDNSRQERTMAGQVQPSSSADQKQ